MGVGLGEAAGSPPAVSLITDTAPVEWRTRALASITLGALVGIGIGTMFGGWMSQYYGWRWALAAVGLPGLGVALLARYTLREPPRNSTEVAPDPLRVARHLCSFPAFNWTVVAACIAGVGSFGRSMWEPTFLSRTYGLTPFEIGTTYLLISALPAAAGAIVASVQADRLGRRDARWPLWICALGNGLGFPCLIAFFLWPTDDTLMLGSLEVPVSYGFSFVGSAFLGFYSAPTGAVAQRFASSNMRAVTHALWTMVFNLIGMGLGPLIVGGLTQTWSDTYGPDALRYALVLITLVLPVSAVAYVVAAARLPKDLVRLEAMEAAEGDGQA
jgi:MFS family permease